MFLYAYDICIQLESEYSNLFHKKKNISRICLKPLLEITDKITDKLSVEIINGQLDIKLKQFVEEELNTVLKK